MQVALQSSHKEQVYNCNQLRVHHCTERLKQLQTQINDKYLKQQFITSVAMKEKAYQKIVQQQNITISYLKQQIRSLQMQKLVCLKLQNDVLEMKQIFLTLLQQNRRDLQLNQIQDQELKIQQLNLNLIINQLNQEGVKINSLKIRLKQKNLMAKELIGQKIKVYAKKKDQLQATISINEARTEQHCALKAQCLQGRQRNVELKGSCLSSNIKFQSNNEKVKAFEEQIKKLEIQKQKLRSIHKAAQKDNTVLKQCLKDKMMRHKVKQQQVQKLTKSKQILGQRNKTQKQTLNKIVQEVQQSKARLISETSKQQQLSQTLQHLISDKLRIQSQLQSVQVITSSEKQGTKTNLYNCLQRQQQVQRSFYFIDQYMIMNAQLIKQIEILHGEEVRKQGSIRNFGRRQKRQGIVSFIKGFLRKAKQQLWSSQKVVTQVRKGFNEYKLRQ